MVWTSYLSLKNCLQIPKRHYRFIKGYLYFLITIWVLILEGQENEDIGDIIKRGESASCKFHMRKFVCVVVS